MKTLRETIRDVTRYHLQTGGLFFAQCTQAVGWIGGTVPSDAPKGSIVELPTSDVSNGGVVVGAALAGRKPIYTIRYQGFITYNGASIFNYAAKSKEMWKTPCPLLVRSIAMEGSIGPVASNSHHSTALRFPGIKVYAPMCPEEWLDVYHEFMLGDDPIYCSEHRKSYDWTERELWRENSSKTTIIGIAGGRLNALQAARELDINYGSLFRLKPLHIPGSIENLLKRSEKVFIVDSDYTICGAAEHLCVELNRRYGCTCYPIGLDDRTAGFSPLKDNLTPSKEEIIRCVRAYQ